MFNEPRRVTNSSLYYRELMLNPDLTSKRATSICPCCPVYLVRAFPEPFVNVHMAFDVFEAFIHCGTTIK